VGHRNGQPAVGGSQSGSTAAVEPYTNIHNYHTAADAADNTTSGLFNQTSSQPTNSINVLNMSLV